MSAFSFLNELQQKFDQRRRDLLLDRKRHVVGFDPVTKEVRESDWTCAPIPEEIKSRQVEITGPPDRKMIINALNSGADVYMCDFEDSCSPTWDNIRQGHTNVKDAVHKTIEFATSKKNYALNEEIALLMVRPRGLHLEEKNCFNMSASLYDVGYFLHNCMYELMAQGRKAYIYIPKIEHYEEAGWWADVFRYCEEYFKVPKGTIRCTVLVEILPAVFQMHEILYELKDYALGLNAGRWDYIFSIIKNRPGEVFPDKNLVDMNQECMETYARLIVDTCRKRGVHPIGGMSAYIPVRGDEEKNKLAIKTVRQDKIIEVSRGFVGAWVAHPGLVEHVRSAFNAKIDDPDLADMTMHFVLKKDETEEELKEKLFKVPTGEITDEGIRNNISEALQYMTAWLQGNGCVVVNNQMSDAATAEIARAQLWQWHTCGKLSTDKFLTILDEEYSVLKEQTTDVNLLAMSKGILETLVKEPTSINHDFITTLMYGVLK